MPSVGFGPRLLQAPGMEQAHLSELDDVSKLAMHLVRLDLWEENNFLRTFEEMEALSEKFVQLCDRDRDLVGNGSTVQSLARMQAPKEMERCKLKRDEAFGKIASHATAELESLAHEVAGGDRQHDQIFEGQKKLVEQTKQFQTNLAIEQRESESHLGGIDEKMEKRIDELSGDILTVSADREASHRRLLQVMEAVGTSCDSMLDTEREQRKLGEEKLLLIMENLFECLELKQEQQFLALKNLSDGVSGRIGDLIQDNQQRQRNGSCAGSAAGTAIVRSRNLVGGLALGGQGPGPNSSMAYSNNAVPTAYRLTSSSGSGAGAVGSRGFPSTVPGSLACLSAAEGRSSGDATAKDRYDRLLAEPAGGPALSSQVGRGKIDPTLMSMYAEIKTRMQHEYGRT